ncbi:hypothetical protein COT78_01150 [Candidatus Berkelbacteria bacterium CG10_big_fil_rev_8_21_14_0_10_43_13]|uniref:RNase H type-1 domain-containing protein n=1 Tax=Candidatus Berkelbacteria bacterium CG10_big_fil_rev_8_21_14_0_10_43_13 TaxID=1974514 RepID=A0A2H0W8Y7_9BACT|nr:MAG: hypothetical protein COT78_01150 [Candidatus Berkelbacteria bacterium CG10_big_fil_rev_8_21_14_0_10_43_13]
MKQLFINTDGGSRGNPGPAAIGVAFFDETEKVLRTHKSKIGVGTNNEAEYQAIIEALKILNSGSIAGLGELVDSKIICRLDSLLVVEQVSGRWKIKQPHIAQFNIEIHRQLADLDLSVSFVHVPREQNKLADKLVNEALDGE